MDNEQLSKIERDFYHWKQDTPREQLTSLCNAIVGTLENMKEGVTTDFEKATRNIVGYAASLNALAPKLKDNKW